MESLRNAARRLAAELGINPTIGSVWTWRAGGRDQILVEIRPGTRVAIPASFGGFPVVVQERLNPTVRGIENDLCA